RTVSGDPRRGAALVPWARRARITLAWCGLSAVAGDREQGRALADALACDEHTPTGASGEAMTFALVSIAAGRAGDLARMRASLARVEARGAELALHDRAFVGYLVGVAQRRAGAPAAARAA